MYNIRHSKGSFRSMHNFMSCIRYNKPLTITNIQLIITKIRVCMCHTGNVWSNMLIRTCIGEPSNRIYCWSITKGEVGRGLIPMTHKLRALLCRVFDVAASWHLICRDHLCCPPCFCCCCSSWCSAKRSSHYFHGKAGQGTCYNCCESYLSSLLFLCSICSEGMLCSICRGRVWGCRQQRCNSWNGLKRTPV